MIWMAFKVKSNLISVEKKLKERQKKLDQAYSAKNMGKVAKAAAELIRRRTRLGKGVNSSGKEEKLTPLAESTIKSRARKNLSSSTRTKKSNLTQTGKMLSDIVGVGRKMLAVVKFRTDDSNDLANIHQNKGTRFKKVLRPFFRLSVKDMTKIKQEIRILLRKIMR